MTKYTDLVGRTHTVADVQEATRIAKDSGLKIVYHLMPGMPGSNPQKDLAAFKRVFTDSAFKPDMIKIYPCLCIAGTKAYEWYQKGTYKPYTTEQATAFIAEVKKVYSAMGKGYACSTGHSSKAHFGRRKKEQSTPACA